MHLIKIGPEIEQIANQLLLPQTTIDAILKEIEKALLSDNPLGNLLTVYSIVQSINAPPELLQNALDSIANALSAVNSLPKNLEIPEYLGTLKFNVLPPITQVKIAKYLENPQNDTDDLMATIELYRALWLNHSQTNAPLVEMLLNHTETIIGSMLLGSSDLEMDDAGHTESFEQIAEWDYINNFELGFPTLRFHRYLQSDVIRYLIRLYRKSIASENPVQSLIIFRNRLMDVCNMEEPMIVEKIVRAKDIKITIDFLSKLITKMLACVALNPSQKQPTDFES